MSLSSATYSPKSILVKGDTKPHAENLRGLKGVYNPYLGGWIFSKKREEAVAEYVNKVNLNVKESNVIQDLQPEVNITSINRMRVLKELSIFVFICLLIGVVQYNKNDYSQNSS